MDDKRVIELVVLRARHALSQKEVAKAIGIHHQTYASKEQGKAPFTVPEAIALMEFFGASFKDIFLPNNYGQTVVGVRKTSKHGYKVEMGE